MVQIISIVNALYCFFCFVFLQKILLSPKHYKSLKTRSIRSDISYFNADNLQKRLVQPLVEQQSNAAVLLLKVGPRPTCVIIVSQTHTISPTNVYVFLIFNQKQVTVVAISVLL